jgi:L-iditol 2-dehydrogenase
MDQGLQSLKKGGKAVIIALYEEPLSLFLTTLVRNEWALMASYGCQPQDYRRAIDIIRRVAPQLQDIIAYYPLTQASAAFADAKQQKILKPILAME